MPPENKQYSHRNFTDTDLSGVDPAELNDTLIVGSCFYQQAGPDADIFPAGMTGVVFEGCNLDNCTIPPGNTVGDGCCTYRIIEQNDGQDWVMDADDKPVIATLHRLLMKDGKNTGPAKIPAEREVP